MGGGKPPRTFSLSNASDLTDGSSHGVSPASPRPPFKFISLTEGIVWTFDSVTAMACDVEFLNSRDEPDTVLIDGDNRVVDAVIEWTNLVSIRLAEGPALTQAAVLELEARALGRKRAQH